MKNRKSNVALPKQKNNQEILSKIQIKILKIRSNKKLKNRNKWMHYQNIQNSYKKIERRLPAKQQKYKNSKDLIKHKKY